MEDNLVKLYDNYSGNNTFIRPVSISDRYCLPDSIVILLCIQGSAKFNVRFREYTLSENSFLAIGAGIPFYYTWKSEDFKVNIMNVTEPVLNNLAQGLVKIYFYRILHECPLHFLSPEKMTMCSHIHRYLKSFVNENDNFFRKQIIRNYMNILFYEACNIMLHEPENRTDKDRHKEEVAGAFIRLLEKNFKYHRKVEFYAQEMNITPKYLSAVIKESTGRTASAWIDDYTVLEAKNMLRTSSSTIQEISYDLGFATPSHFAKFFKDKTGMTPKEARMRFEF